MVGIGGLNIKDRSRGPFPSVIFSSVTCVASGVGRDRGLGVQVEHVHVAENRAGRKQGMGISLCTPPESAKHAFCCAGKPVLIRGRREDVRQSRVKNIWK